MIKKSMRICVSLQHFNFALPLVCPVSKVSVATSFSQSIIDANGEEFPTSLSSTRRYLIKFSSANGHHAKSSNRVNSFKRKVKNKNYNEVNDESHDGSQSGVENENITSKTPTEDELSEKSEIGLETEGLAEGGSTIWWKFWENNVRRSSAASSKQMQAKEDGKNDRTAEAPEFVKITKEEESQGPFITGAKDTEGRWTWLLGFKKKKKDDEIRDRTDRDSDAVLVVQEYKNSALEWRDFLDPSPENVLALTLTGILVLSVIQICWQLVLAAGAIILSAIKYSVLAAFLVAFIVFFL